MKFKFIMRQGVATAPVVFFRSSTRAGAPLSAEREAAAGMPGYRKIEITERVSK